MKQSRQSPPRVRFSLLRYNNQTRVIYRPDVIRLKLQRKHFTVCLFEEEVDGFSRVSPFLSGH